MMLGENDPSHEKEQVKGRENNKDTMNQKERYDKPNLDNHNDSNNNNNNNNNDNGSDNNESDDNDVDTTTTVEKESSKLLKASDKMPSNVVVEVHDMGKHNVHEENDMEKGRYYVEKQELVVIVASEEHGLAVSISPTYANNNNDCNETIETNILLPNTAKYNIEDDIVDKNEPNHHDDGDSPDHDDDGSPDGGNIPKKKVTPLPLKKVTIVFIMFLSDAMSFTSLMPYVAYMVKDFGLTNDERLLGYYAGLVAGSYFVAQCISCFFWGYLSDRIGRRPVLLFGLIGSCIAIISFGFSRNMWTAMIARSLYGLLNGNIGVFKTYLGEITDSTNQARAFSVLALTFGAGSILGPMIGGYLCRPMTQYPILENYLPGFISSILSTFPYLLPNLIIFFFGLLSLTLAIFFLDESNVAVLEKKSRNAEKYKHLEDDKIQIELQNISSNTTDNDHTGHQEREIEQDISVESVNEEAKQKSDDPHREIKHKMQSPPSKQDTKSKIPVNEIVIGKIRYPSWWPKNELCREAGPLTTASLYALTGMAQTIFDEVMPLFSLLPIEQGGLQFSTSNIGTLGMCSGISIIFFQLLVVPQIVKRFGCLKVFRMGTLMMVILYPLFPEIGRLAALDGIAPQVIMWVILIVFVTTRIFCSVCAFTSIMILQNNSVFPQNMGKLNGFGQTGVAAGRAIGPILAGSLFAWSNVNGLPFPFSHHFVFLLGSAIFLFLTAASFTLKSSYEKPKMEVYAEMQHNNSALPEF